MPDDARRLASRSGGLVVVALAVVLGIPSIGCVGDLTLTFPPDDNPLDDDDNHTQETVPPGAAPWSRDEVETPGPVTFTELHYNPPSDGALEWLEIHNPMVLDMDLSGWSLDDGVTFTFAEGTVLPAGGYLVVAADPALLEDETGFDEALGPYGGTLSNGGERIELFSNGGRLIDSVGYSDDDPWPVAPDGSGLSLAKMAPTAASDRAEHWMASAELGGTPGAPNGLDPLALPVVATLVDKDATWRYDASGDYPAADWAETDYDDSGWESGQAAFYYGGVEEDVAATVWATADNYVAAYLGQADGNDLRLVGEDSDGNWTTVEEIAVVLTPWDHLYLAAWEAYGDSYSPQMTIAEVELPDDVVGTSAGMWEWVLGPSGANPGELPAYAPPTEAEIVALVGDANNDSAWQPPAVEAVRGSSPWGATVGNSFSDAALYIWGDTFDDDSVTNGEDTYALFRSRDPVVGNPGNMELDEITTTLTFRTDFTFEGDPSATTLSLDCAVDDGAVFYINGAEVLRENMPNGAVNAGTLAEAGAGEPVEINAEISGDPLVPGFNVLAAEVHQAEVDDQDMAFGCALTAEFEVDRTAPTILLNEVASTEEDPIWVELINVSVASLDVGGLVLATSAGDEVVVPDGVLEPGDLRVLDELGLPLEAGDRLFLYSADGDAVLDAVRAHEWVRARAQDGGPWRVPSQATPGEANLVDLTEDVVIHEIMYHRAPLSQEGEPATERTEEWLELINRGAAEVDLGGWQLVDAVGYEFPEGTTLAPGGYLVVASDAESLREAYPDITVLGNYTGRLGNRGDRILLLDALGNPADEVRYHDGGRWPDAADGGGSSLELRDPWAGNTAAEAWAASDEGRRSEWVQVSYRGEAGSSAVGPDGVWEELVLGLLDAGEVLIDDLSVVRDPDDSAEEILHDGGFDDAERWRLLGNHRHSQVVPDPDDPSNPVLRLVATGPTEHMHNHVETTLALSLAAQEYEISFRARWLSGSNQLHSRLYFNRLARTTLVEQPSGSGTPGEENSTFETNLGPTFTDLNQDVVVPAPGEPVLVAVTVDDPDGVAAVTLWSSVDGGSFHERAMAESVAGRWEAEIDGQGAGSVVQFYVEAIDDLGATATYPAAGPDSRALFAVDDGQAAAHGLHNLRILMTEADSDWLHQDIHLMSNDRVGATVVYGEAEAFYDVGVRLKGSQRGRPVEARLGYAVRFHDEQPFRGSHTSVLIDRSEGVGYGQREVLLNLVMTRAGAVSGEYNDLIHLIAPRSEYNGAAELQLGRFSDLVLGSQFDGGERGERFEYELIYYPTTTDDGTIDGYKLPQPDSVIGTPITDLGDGKEAYRWNFIHKNNLRLDDHDDLIALCQTFALSGQSFLDAAPDVIDVEQWLRAFAFATLSGATDQYGGAGSQHNAQFYVRPDDRLALYFPHDLDYFGSYAMDVVGNSDLARLIQDPVYKRSYYGHLNDIIQSAYNTGYLAPWCDQLDELLPGQDFDSHCQFIDDRAGWVLSGSSESVMTSYPPVDFHITTAGGDDFTVTSLEATLEGEAWVDVRGIALDDPADPLDLTWLDGQTWQVTVPLEEGDNPLTLVATDLHGEIVGTDSIVVTAE